MSYYQTTARVERITDTGEHIGHKPQFLFGTFDAPLALRGVFLFAHCFSVKILCHPTQSGKSDLPFQATEGAV